MFTNISIIPASSIKTNQKLIDIPFFVYVFYLIYTKNRVGEDFYVRVLEGGRITIPKLVVELLEVEAGDVVYVTLYEAKPP